MALVIKRCPHCRALLPDVNASVYVASPLRQCMSCRQHFIDPERKEWDASGLGFKSMCVLKVIFSALAYANLLLLAIYVVWPFFTKHDYDIVIMSVLPLALSIFLLIKFGKELRRDIQKSRKRTDNLEYVEKLRAIGFKI